MDPRIIDALSGRAWEKAVNLWSQTRNDLGGCTDSCVWGGAGSLVKCARCLEGRLRTMSLIIHRNDGEQDLYLELSRRLSEWSRQLPD